MKKVLAILLAVIAILGLVGCGSASADSDKSPVYNKDMFDFVYGYDRAIIKLANDEVIEVKIKKWTDYEDGEQIQITAEDGTVYLTSSFRCDLIKDN